VKTNLAGWRRTASLLVLAWLALVLLGWLVGQFVKLPQVTDLDRHVLDVIAPHRSQAATVAARSLTTAGSSVLLLPLSLALALVLFVRHHRGEPALVAVTAVGAYALLQVVKVLVDRPRPPLPHLVEVTNASFPSVHSGDALADYGVIAWTVARLAPWAFLRLGIVALSPILEMSLKPSLASSQPAPHGYVRAAQALVPCCSGVPGRVGVPAACRSPRGRTAPRRE
jgi:hypothetical protein